jgi:c-di-GMP-binding flagellar brake protein YcgR
VPYAARSHQPTSRPFDDELTDLEAISAVFDGIRSTGSPIFITDPATGASFLAQLLSVDKQRNAFTVGHFVPEYRPDTLADNGPFQVLAAVEDADFTFEVTFLDPGAQNDAWCELQFPAVVHRLRRRREYRGPGFGLAEVHLHCKSEPRSKARKAPVRDISDGGIGILISRDEGAALEPGALFDDCVLLLNGNPVAACVIEIRHVHDEPQTSTLIAGGRFLDLDATSQRRISMMVTTVQCEEIRRRQPVVTH